MTTDTAVPTSDIDLFDEAVLADREPYFAQLRDLAPVVYLAKNDTYALTRYEVVRDALARPNVFSSAKVAFNDDMNAALAGTSLAADPPEHTALRAALSENLAPRVLRKHNKEEIEAKADAFIERLVAEDRFDAVTDLARVFPIEVVTDVIGLKDVAAENFLRWGEAAFNVLGPMNRRTVENFPIAGELFSWIGTVTQDDLEEGSIGWAVFEAGRRGAIPADAPPHIIHQYIGAGLDTTMATIGNMWNLLGTHPDQYALLRADPSLVPAALAEVLRFEAPVHAFGRVATEDVEIEGVEIPSGAQVAILFSAANRDPRHYEDPHTFAVQRNPVDHVGFGYGVHSCAGQFLAKLEIQGLLSAWIARVKTFEAGAGERRVANMTRQFGSLPVHITARN